MIAVTRVNPAPDIVGNNYRTPEVLAALGRTFYSKCYICERVYGEPQAFHVEHFHGQTANPDLIGAWDNLYLACNDCNLTKLRIMPAGGYLDPCNPTDQIESRIQYELDFDITDRAAAVRFIPLSNDAATYNTCDLLERAHNGHDANTRLKTATLRDQIAVRAGKLTGQMLEHYRAQRANDPIRTARAQANIRQLTSRASPFTMLLRSTVVSSEPEFIALFD